MGFKIPWNRRLTKQVVKLIELLAGTTGHNDTDTIQNLVMERAKKLSDTGLHPEITTELKKNPVDYEEGDE